MAYISEQAISDFDEKMVSERTPQVELDGSLPLTDLRDAQQTSGTGSITDSTSEFRVRHTTAGDFARLTSKKRGEYQPGTSLKAGIGVRLDTTSLSGDGKGVWGYFDMQTGSTEDINDGFVFGLDSSGLFVEVIKSGTSKHKTYQASWNVNTSAITASELSEGNIFQIDFTYYGYGLIKFQVIKGTTGDVKQRVETVHTVRLTNETSADNPNLQIGALAKSSSTTGDFSIFVGGREVTVHGRFRQRTRATTHLREGQTIGGSYEPIMTFRKKQTFRQVASSIIGMSLLTDNDIAIQIRLNATITGGTTPSFGALSDTPASETSFEVDTTADSIDTGTGVKIFETLVKGGDMANRSDMANLVGLPLEVPDEGEITFAAKNLGTSASVDFVGIMEESF